MPGDQFPCGGDPGAQAGGHGHDLGSARAHRRQLDLRGVGRDDDDRGHGQPGGGVTDGARVVAARVGNHAPPPCLAVQRADRRIGATDLE